MFSMVKRAVTAPMAVRCVLIRRVKNIITRQYRLHITPATAILRKSISDGAFIIVKAYRA